MNINYMVSRRVVFSNVALALSIFNSAAVKTSVNLFALSLRDLHCLKLFQFANCCPVGWLQYFIFILWKSLFLS